MAVSAGLDDVLMECIDVASNVHLEVVIGIYVCGVYGSRSIYTSGFVSILYKIMFSHLTFLSVSNHQQTPFSLNT